MVVVRAFFFFLRFDDSRDLSVVDIGFEIRVDAIEKIPVWFGSDQVYIVSIDLWIQPRGYVIPI